MEPSKRGPLTVWLRTSPITRSSFDVRAEFDSVTQNLRSTSFSGGVFLPSVSASATWFASYDPTSGDVTSSQTRVSSAFGPPRGPWRIELHGAYDIFRSKLIDQRYVVRWQGSCWAAYAEVRDYRISPYDIRRYRVSIDLAGLGKFLEFRGRLGGRLD